LVKQGNLTLFATSLKVSDFMQPGFYSIERLDPENANEKGYQRLLNKSRAKKIADYIIKGQDTRDVFLPTSIFMATEKDIKFNPSNNTIEIDTNEIGSFNIVDGQHRIEGLKLAAEKDQRVLEFEIPVNIGVNLNEIEQMCHFLIVNTTQKSVEEGVAQRIKARLSSQIDVEKMPSLPKWILNSVQKSEDSKALGYIDYLNSSLTSPWKNKIKMANTESKEGVINQKSFVKAIKKYILVADNPLEAEHMDEKKQHKIFENYWRAIIDVIGDESTSVLYKYNGVFLFCMFAIPFFQKLRDKQDFTVPTMKKLLEHAFDNAESVAAGIGHSDFWTKGGKASGLNTGALGKINAELVTSLYKSQSDININDVKI
ncbi:MAG: DGQHR domain-containing protein, partial [Desulfovibrio sp.]|nr:DGQHR domain-containing protein [Desulfovibrio sp.]